MLQSLFYFILISIFCVVWGLPLYLYNGYKRKIIHLTFEEIIFSFLIGLVLISVFSSWVSLFRPVRFSTLIAFTLPLIFLEIFWLKGKKWTIDLSFFTHLKIAETFFLILSVLLFTFLSVGKPTMEDTDLYHVQNINWIYEFGTVPGLANLYLRYGFYSNWFHVISMFQLPFQNQNFLYLNYTFTVWIFLFIFYQYSKYSTTKDNIGKHLKLFYFATLLFLLFEWDLFRVASSSTSYDFVITSITLVSLHLLLKKILFNNLSLQERNILILLLVAAPFFKITGFLIAPLILPLLFFSREKKQMLLTAAFFSIACLIPYTYKNYIQTGYIFFPYQFADFFYPAWRVPKEMVSKFNEYIYLGNHYINQDIPKAAWANDSAFSYYNNWFLHLVTADKILMILSLVSLPVSLLSLKKIYAENLKKILVLYFVCIVSLSVWIISSPDLRFAFAFLIFIFLFPLTAIVIHYIKQWFYTICISLFLIVAGLYIYKKESQFFKLKNLLHVKTIDIPAFTPININSQLYNIPKIINNNWNSRCLNCPLPCIYHTNPYLQPLGKEIKDGFKMYPYPDSVFIENYRY